MLGAVEDRQRVVSVKGEMVLNAETDYTVKYRRLFQKYEKEHRAVCP